MEKLSRTFYPVIKDYRFNNIMLNLKINNNPYNIDLDHLIKIARRINPKRSYLFVSKVIGKHIPISPYTLKIIGALLARNWLKDSYGISSDDVYILIDELMKCTDTSKTYTPGKSLLKILDKKFSLKRRTLFIGFAETATGLAHSFFSNFSNCTLINTTRVSFKNNPYCFSFSEPHSHAVEHTLYTFDKDFFQGFDEMVLIDDELTTGTTALNLIKCLPCSRFSIVSILDWRNSKNTKISIPKNTTVLYSSLIQGNVLTCETFQKEYTTNLHVTPFSSNIEINEIRVDKLLKYENYLISSGRFGITSEDNNGNEIMLKEIGEMLNPLRKGSKTLCIGDEELIYIPCVISMHMGHSVLFQSTTRSPIQYSNEKGYGVFNKFYLKDKSEHEADTFLYNIPIGAYEHVFYFSEKPLSEQYKNLLANTFNQLKIKYLTIVTFGGY